jgi:hypothetical protein
MNRHGSARRSYTEGTQDSRKRRSIAVEYTGFLRSEIIFKNAIVTNDEKGSITEIEIRRAEDGAQ